MRLGKVNKNIAMVGFSFFSDQDRYYDSNINPYESGVTEWGFSLNEKEHWAEFIDECSDDIYLWLKNDALKLKMNNQLL